MADPHRPAAAAGATIIESVPEGRTLSANKVNDVDNYAQDDLSLLSWLMLFRQERHSLRLSASNIAAVAGYHPWKELPQLLFEHIYQSRRGQLLLQQDCDNLSIELIDITPDDDDLALQQLAAKAGVSVQAALDVKNGKRVLHSVDEIQDLKESILKKARLKDAAEMKELTEAVRSAIDTSFGTYHEDDALDQYQRMTGWPVTGRNSETMVWEHFDSDGPPSKVYPLPRRQQRRDAAIAADDGSRDGEAADGKDSSNHAEPVSSTSRKADEASDMDTYSACTRQEQGAGIDAKRQQDVTSERPRPFFSIRGSIDGIREELMIRDRPVSKVDDDDEDDDDSFCTRPVIVECKHRTTAKAIAKSPPLHDQIQTVVYMLMYQVDQADIIQVLRSKNNGAQKRKRNGDDIKNKTPEMQDVMTEGSSTRTTTTTTGSVPQQQPLSTTKIAVHRISLDDPVHRHRFHWEQTVLPRIWSFVDVVYSFRADDHRRYMLLLAIASKANHDAWKILFEACPWLELSDTAFRRNDATATTGTAAAVAT
jgi:hypothetical protein